jgi:hypothetical protein
VIALDSPFVRAVLAIVDDDANFDDAIEVLLAAEAKHGVRIVREEKVGSLACTWVPVGRRPTSREFRSLMASYGDGPGGSEAFARAWAGLYRHGDDADSPDEQLFPFIGETQLLLGGMDFANDHWIEFPNGAIASWTQRAWGGQLARWALATDWHPERRLVWAGDMGYAHFAFYLDTEIERYEEWCRTALEVIRRKCERQLDT